MERKRFFEARHICCEDGRQADLSYYCLWELSGLCESYGVLVEMEAEGAWESACASQLTTSPAKIREILSLLSRNTVTPCTLCEVIQDEINKF